MSVHPNAWEGNQYQRTEIRAWEKGRETVAGSGENNEQFHKLLEIKLGYHMKLIEKIINITLSDGEK